MGLCWTFAGLFNLRLEGVNQLEVVMVFYGGGEITTTKRTMMHFIIMESFIENLPACSMTISIGGLA